MKQMINKKSIRQSTWQQFAPLIIFVYEEAGVKAGGDHLYLAPEGRIRNMPVEIKQGFFSNILIPGFILSGFVILTTFAVNIVLGRTWIDELISGLTLSGIAIWFIIETAVLQEFRWIRAIWGPPVIVCWMVALPMLFLRLKSSSL